MNNTDIHNLWPQIESGLNSKNIFKTSNSAASTQERPLVESGQTWRGFGKLLLTDFEKFEKLCGLMRRKF